MKEFPKEIAIHSIFVCLGYLCVASTTALSELDKLPFWLRWFSLIFGSVMYVISINVAFRWHE